MDIGRTLPAHVAGLAEALVESSGDGIAVLQADASITLWNASAAEFTGVAQCDAVGAFARDLFEDAQILLDIPFDGASHHRNLVIGAGPGKRTIRAVVRALGTSDAIDGWILSLAPQRRHAEIEQLKSEFVGALSHELKTPLATIKAFAEMLRTRDLTREQTTEYLLTIDEQTDRLAGTIDDLLSLSRVESDQLLTQRIVVSVETIVDRALALRRDLSDVAPRIERRVAGAAISGDPELITQALSHVVDNAIKFSTSPAPVVISAEQRDDGCAIVVADRGIGIADEHLAYIFDRFYRAGHDLTSPAGGTGVGLFIADAIVRAHGGAIYVISEPGEGSTFTLWFPVRA